MARVGTGVILLYGVAIVAIPIGDKPILSAVQSASRGFSYSITAFEVRNLPDKWLHLLYSAMPWWDLSDERRRSDLESYMELAPEIRRARSELDGAIAEGDAAAQITAQARLDDLRGRFFAIRDSVEELVERAISKQIVSLGLNQWGDFVWPPVDIRMDHPPSIVVASPRDVIRREEVKLLLPELSESEKRGIESEILESADLSAVVLRTGGLAVYPNVVPSDWDLLPLLEVAAHEWLHAYLIFHPLGRAYWQSAEMTSLNETLASIAGDEIGRLAYNDLMNENIETSVPPASLSVVARSDVAEPEGFDFRDFMYQTRVRADELLADGQIEDAEAYMEARRQTLVSEGYNIRKINQAYFAFHGLYADSPSSVSPLARQLWEIRQISADAGDFVKTLQTVSSQQGFESLLDRFAVER